MSAFDLSQLPALPAIEQVDAEAIITDLRNRIVELYPPGEAVIDLESEPLRKQIENFALREAMLRTDFNQRALSLTLASAKADALDHIGVTYYFTPRQVLVAADAQARPPIAQVLEADADYRRRIVLAWDSKSTAGAAKSYEYHALSASVDVRDVHVSSPRPGTTTVTVLARSADGVPSAATLKTVRAALNDQDVRPLCEEVIVQAAQRLDYTLAVALTLPAGPERAAVLALATASLRAFVQSKHALNTTVTVAGVYAAAMVAGVANATSDLAQDLVPGEFEAPYCTTLTVDGEVVTL